MREYFRIVLIVNVSLLLFLSPLIAAPEPILPDFSVSSDDITFSPSNCVHYGTDVTINASIHNNGICWIRLDDFLDYAGYDFSLNASNYYTFDVEIRWRAIVTISGYIKIGFSFANFDADTSLSWYLTTDTEWTNDSSGTFPAVRTPVLQTGHTLKIVWLDPQISPANATLLLDWVKLSINEYESLIDLDPSTRLLLFEAETYNSSHSSGINAIYPSDVVAQFFVDDPSTGGLKIDGDQKFGDQNFVHDQGKFVYYVRNNGIGNAIVPWTANSPGVYSIYTMIDPSDVITESDEANNMAYNTISVYATLVINVSDMLAGTTNPAPGLWNYTGGLASVSATSYPSYSFIGWVLDGSFYLGTNRTVSVTMDVDHNLTAHFQRNVGGYRVTLDKFSLAAPYIGLGSAIVITAGVLGVFLRRTKRRGDKKG